MPSLELNRRLWIKSAALSFGVLAYRALGKPLESQFFYDSHRPFDTFTLPQNKRISPHVHGIIGNTFDLANEKFPDQIAGYNNAQLFNCSSLRLFVPDTFEQKKGVYDFGELDRIIQTAQLVHDKSKGKRETGLCLFNGYRYWRSNSFNPVYNSDDLLGGIYLPEDIASLNPDVTIAYQNDFFTNPETISYFLKRCEAILQYIKNSPISYIEIVNEPLYQADPNTARLKLTDWYKQILGRIRNLHPTIPIVTGTVRLEDVDNDALYEFAPIIASVHDYPDITADYVAKDTAYIPQKVPYGIFEIGLPNVLYMPVSLQDYFLSRYIESMIKHFLSAGSIPSCIGLWQLNKNRTDNFYLNARSFPKTRETLISFQEILDKIYK